MKTPKPLSYKTALNRLAANCIKSEIERPKDIMAGLMHSGSAFTVAQIYRLDPFDVLDAFNNRLKHLRLKSMTPAQRLAVSTP